MKNKKKLCTFLFSIYFRIHLMNGSNMKRIGIFLLMATVLLVSSCTKEDSNNVNQDKIWAEYYFEYNDNTGITSARAVFKFSSATGTLLQLNDSAKVTFNGDTLTYNAILGYYEKQYPSFIDSGSFAYTDLDHHTFTNPVQMVPTTSIPDIETISKSSAYSFAWDGSALTNNERVNVTFSSTANNQVRVFTTSNVGATSVLFPIDQMAQLGVGPYGKIQMERLRNPQLSMGTSAGGIITCKYTPKDKSGITITE